MPDETRTDLQSKATTERHDLDQNGECLCGRMGACPTVTEDRAVPLPTPGIDVTTCGECFQSKATESQMRIAHLPTCTRYEIPLCTCPDPYCGVSCECLCPGCEDASCAEHGCITQYPARARYCEGCSVSGRESFDGACVHYWRHVAYECAMDTNEADRISEKRRQALLRILHEAESAQVLV